MSQSDWCAFCLLEWEEKSLETRKGTTPNRARTTVNGTRVCHEQRCHDLAREKPE